MTNAIITDTLPSHVSFVSASGGGKVSTGKVTWSLGTLNPGGKGSFTLVVKVLTTATPGTAIKNSATIDSDQTPATSQGDKTNVCDLCGNGKVDSGETCDTGITSGTGKCPTTCDDYKPCTTDALTGSKCTAKCVYTPITKNINGDGCCPPGATVKTDSDCKTVCGNGLLGTCKCGAAAACSVTTDTCVSGVCRCGSGTPCVTPQVCSGGKCTGCTKAAHCDDKLTCTTDTCISGACSWIVVAGTCLISGTCYAFGAPCPTDKCKICNPALSWSSWTAVAGCSK